MTITFTEASYENYLKNKNKIINKLMCSNINTYEIRV